VLNINLKNNEVKFLINFIKKGLKNARSLTRARILLLANQGKGDTEIAKTLGVGRSTALRIRKRGSVAKNSKKYVNLEIMTKSQKIRGKHTNIIKLY
jgi:IS30 family transposase